MKIKLRCFLIVFALSSLVGCGLKGPLYMPGDENAGKKTERVYTKSSGQNENDAVAGTQIQQKQSVE